MTPHPAQVPPLVALMLSEPGMPERLQAQHGDDGTRHCRSCSGGAQTGRFTFPCSLYEAALNAIAIATARRGTTR